MLFTVVFGIFMVIFNKANACPSILPCKTVNGTQGSCVQSKECPHIQRLSGANLTPEELDYVKKSVCGIDLDKSKLFCCDNKEVRPLKEKVADKYDSDDSNNLNTSVDANVQRISSYTPTTPDFTQVSTSTIGPSEPKVVYCQTPNGEKAQCISIYLCTNILRNLLASPNKTEDQRRFLKESGCGFEDQLPLVCCGSDTNFKENNTEESSISFQQNALIPAGSCGIQNTEIAIQAPVPLISQRLVQGRTMNFTLPNRIFGGQNAELGEFPWLVLLTYETYEGSKKFACAGSLVSSRYVLTAAHCVSAQNIGKIANKLTSIRVGEWNLANAGPDCITTGGLTVCNEAEVDIGIESIYPHPGYTTTSKEKFHDIALIRLNRDVKFTQFVRPICLPSVDNYVAPGERLTISGWGIINYDEETTIKQKVEVPVVSRSQCSIMFEKSSRLSRVGKGQLCAGGEAGKDACAGDSGAPLMRRIRSNTSDQDVWYIEGVVSFGTGCGLVNHYGIYTKVSEYLGWIHSTIAP